MNIEQQNEHNHSRYVRIRIRQEDDSKRKRITPSTVLAILLLSAVVGVIVGIGAGKLIQLFWREKAKQEHIAEALRNAAFASQTESTIQIVIGPSPEADE